ncbi:hypothetical protein FGB62_257g03 [Gracilaria domingensis]|nr:hypothetical protein FGB62_257g03 [Gracilaria domingensis]
MAWLAWKKRGKGGEQLVQDFVAELVKEKMKGEKRRGSRGELLRATVRGAWSMRSKGIQILEDDSRSTAAVYLSGCPASLSRRSSVASPLEGSFSDRAQVLFMRDVFANAGRGQSEARWDVHGKCCELFEGRIDLVFELLEFWVIEESNCKDFCFFCTGLADLFWENSVASLDVLHSTDSSCEDSTCPAKGFLAQRSSHSTWQHDYFVPCENVPHDAATILLIRFPFAGELRTN